ncbi:MAG: hypothetical protein LKF00_09295 [Olsenella sp.]|jgi:hypothetical protein|nr:hypothetical protein [Olsenella sp.]MCI1289058.1 hypothetical protein [Olsenella sp.]
MGEAECVVAALRALGHDNAFALPVAPRVCEEPVVVTAGAFSRESLQADGSERGRRALVARVCMDDPGDAEATARAVAAGLRATDWAALCEARGIVPRALACDAAQPAYAGRDGSGRWLWDVALSLTVVC